jgi:hypothetical protein
MSTPDGISASPDDEPRIGELFDVMYLDIKRHNAPIRTGIRATRPFGPE